MNKLKHQKQPKITQKPIFFQKNTSIQYKNQNPESKKQKQAKKTRATKKVYQTIDRRRRGRRGQRWRRDWIRWTEKCTGGAHDDVAEIEIVTTLAYDGGGEEEAKEGLKKLCCGEIKEWAYVMFCCVVVVN